MLANEPCSTLSNATSTIVRTGGLNTVLYSQKKFVAFSFYRKKTSEGSIDVKLNSPGNIPYQLGIYGFHSCYTLTHFCPNGNDDVSVSNFVQNIGSPHLVGTYSGTGNYTLNSTNQYTAYCVYMIVDAAVDVSNFTFSLSEVNTTGSGSLLFDEPDCREECCLPEFSPSVGKYIVSAWVSEESYVGNEFTFSNPRLKIVAGSNSYDLTATGEIIDGWQKIEAEIEIPSDATEISIQLLCSTGNCFFDDIRFFPTDGSMLSYVYDNRTFRLVAELDERNYATFYEYNEEGKLTRIKKETAKGIMTIQENRESIIAKP
jgi:hypothetical protein